MQLEGLIPMACGIYGSLLGFGVIAPGKDPARREEWMRKFGPMMKVCGPMMMFFGVAQLMGWLS